MTGTHPFATRSDVPRRRVATRRTAFTLVELLTVVAIIALLIGILIPSINAARIQAKKATSASTLRSIDVALEMFRGDNESDFSLTHGYPPSFSHPPISGYSFDAEKGQFPFLNPKSESNPPTVYGAHWLPAMLMGVDALGYVKRSTVTKKEGVHQKPWLWYTPDPADTGHALDRQPFYLDPGNVKVLATEKLPGRPPATSTSPLMFPEWDDMKKLPVIVDAFDYPILYYVASSRGRTSNLVGDVHEKNNSYTGGTQQDGVPFYFHQDNVGFTGSEETAGWEFVSSRKVHAIAKSGAKLDALELTDPENFDTFARYIVDRKVFTNLVSDENRKAESPLQPVNKTSYLLISPGPDGLYGTSDDVTNLPRWPDN